MAIGSSLALLALVPLSAPQDFVPRGQLLDPIGWVETLFPADVDGDGELEVLALDVRFVTTRIRLWDGAPDGTWNVSLVVPNGYLSDPVVADFDGDGADDLAVAIEISTLFRAECFVYFGEPAGTPLGRVQLGPSLAGERFWVTAIDFDGDGDQDVVMQTEFERGVYRNDGARVFTEVLREPMTSTRGLTAIDVDGDGLEDLIIGGLLNGPPAEVVWARSLGDGTFAPAAPYANAPGQGIWRFTRADMDGDGDMDVVANEASGPATSFAERESFWLQVESGQPIAYRQDHSVGVVPNDALALDNVQDANLDGIPDLTTRVLNGPLVVQFGLGGGDFGSPVRFTAPLIRTSIALDVDLDGDMDLVSGQGEWFENVSVVSQPVCAGAPNSTGVAGELTARGSELVALGRTFLVGDRLPPGAFGMFLTSTTTSAPTPLANSAGTLCLGANIGRFNRPGEVRAAGTGGTLSLRLDLGDVPDPLATSVAIAAPETRAFQLWYRDVAGGGAAANLTGAIQVTFR